MAADCLAKMLTIEPHDRVDVAALLEHPFLQQYRWPEWEEPPSRNILSAAKDDIQLYDDSTMGVTEWREKVYDLITTTWQSSLGWKENEVDGEGNSPRQAPQPLDSRDLYKITFASNLTVFSPLIGVLGYKVVQRYFPEKSPQQHLLCGGIIFLSTLIVSRVLK